MAWLGWLAGISSTGLIAQEPAILPTSDLELLQPAPSGSPSPGEELVELRERIATLEADFEASLNPSDEGAKDELKSDAKAKDGSKEKSSDKGSKSESKTDAKKKEGWTVKMGGHVQMDYITWANAAPSIPDTFDYFQFRRLRMTADGTGYENYDFRLQMTMEPENAQDNPQTVVLTPQVKDAYLSLNEIPILGRFRIGNFFVPFGLEQVTNDTMNIFLERSIPTQGIFTADREVGMAFYNTTESKRTHWATGLFIDSLSEGAKIRRDDNQGLRLSGRLTHLPYYDEASKGRYLVHTGLGVLYTQDQDNRAIFRARPQVFEGPRLISSGVLPIDDYTTGNFEAAIVWGRFTVQSEGYLCGIDMRNGDWKRANGAYIHFSWFVTGENRVYERFGQHGSQFGRNVPYRNFAASKNGFSPGALELKARWSHFDLNDLQAGQYNDSTFGFNWYWSDRVRMMFDWIHPITSDTTLFGATKSDLIGTRFDFNW